MDNDLATEVRKQMMARLGGVIRFGSINPHVGKCDHCERENVQVAVAPCRTAYHDDALNVPMTLCEDCTEAYNDYWDEMWAQVRG